MATAETPEEKLQALHDYIVSDEFDDELLADWEIAIIENTVKYTQTRSMTVKEEARIEAAYEKFWKWENRSSY